MLWRGINGHCWIAQIITDAERRLLLKALLFDVNNLEYQPCDCQGFEETMYPLIPDKNKSKHIKGLTSWRHWGTAPQASLHNTTNQVRTVTARPVRIPGPLWIFLGKKKAHGWLFTEQVIVYQSKGAKTSQSKAQRHLLRISRIQSWVWWYHMYQTERQQLSSCDVSRELNIRGLKHTTALSKQMLGWALKADIYFFIISARLYRWEGMFTLSYMYKEECTLL